MKISSIFQKFYLLNSLLVLVNCAGIAPSGRILGPDGQTHSIAVFKESEHK
jgi:hypothetical protein